jgi:hypothetical protein
VCHFCSKNSINGCTMSSFCHVSYFCHKSQLRMSRNGKNQNVIWNGQFSGNWHTVQCSSLLKGALLTNNNSYSNMSYWVHKASRRLVSFVLMRGLFRNTPFAVTNWLRGVEWTERVETNQYAHILIIFSSCSNKITIRQKLKIKKLPVTLQLNIFFKNILHNFSFEAFMKLKL